MYASVLFRRIFVSNVLIILGGTVIFSFFCIPDVRQTITGKEEAALTHLLEDVCDFAAWRWDSRSFPATGGHTDMAAHKKAMIQDIRAYLKHKRIPHDSQILLFNAKGESLLPTPSEVQTKKIWQLLSTARPATDGTVPSACGPISKIVYKQSISDTSDSHVCDKVAWGRTVGPWGWHIAVSVSAEEMDRLARLLADRMVMAVAFMFLLCTILGGLFFNHFTLPIRYLANLAAEYLRKKDNAVNRYVADKGEIGILGAGIYRMRENLDTYKDELLRCEEVRATLSRQNDQVRETAFDLSIINKKLAYEVAAYEKVQTELKKSEERYRAMLENIEEYFYEVDLLGNLIFFNDALHKMLGYAKEELLGMNFREYMEPETAEKAYHTFKRAYETGQPDKGVEWRLIRKDGSRCHVEISVALIRDEDGEIMGFRGIARDVSELLYLVYHDSLTGLYNRKAFFERLKEALACAKRDKKEKHIFYLDLDKFKQVNDNYGHDVGDEVLKAVSDRLRVTLRETDHICRLGGDEFTVILNTNSGDSCPGEAARRIIEALSRPYLVGPYRIDFVTPSIGISTYPGDAQDIENLIKCADIAMFKAKERGGRYAFYEKSFESDFVPKGDIPPTGVNDGP